MEHVLRQALCLNVYMDMEKPDLTGRIGIFLSLVLCVHDLHKQDCVYNDLNPNNILIDTRSRSVTLVPSEISSNRNNKGTESDTKAATISGQVAYISPEQTGRTAHPVDFRSNYYSLGVIFYQLLTGSVPFAFEQPFQAIHAHIAMSPPPVTHVNPDIPMVLSHIVSKLLAKNPADRYQNAASLISDLETCLFQLKTTRTIQPFEIAKNDMSPIFEIPKKLYGRHKEIKILTDACNRIQSKGTEIIFLNGAPGIGKSFLVNQVQSHFFENNGYFISGKFNQYEPAIPCSAILQAFSGLVHRMLTLDDKELARKHKLILDAVGDNGKLIIDVIPELELIIGKQPEPEKLAPMEARNRFNYTFQKFIRSVTDNDFPLIIFMDDLHWAENASLNLLEMVLSDVELRNILFIGAYRNIEGRENPFLGEFIHRICQKKRDTQFITLGPVEEDYVELFIEDILAIEGNDLDEFIKIIAGKTNFNPLFIREFLISLYEEGLLCFTPVQDSDGRIRRHIDIAAVRSANLPNTVVELLTQRIKKLSAGTRESLKIAACIGTRFPSDLVAEIHQKKSVETETWLKEAIDQGMVIQTEEQFSFIHDRVREAAYQLNDQQTRMMIHHAVGQALLPKMSKEAAPDVFMVTSQLNSARQRLNPDEREQLIQLNFSAGKKAKKLTAYPIALDYFKTGLDVLGENAWEAQYTMALNLYTEAAETAYLSADIGQAEKLLDSVIDNAHTLLDRIHAHEIRLRCLESRHRKSDVIREGLSVLDQLGINIPPNPGKLRILWEFIAVSYLLRRGEWQKLKRFKDTAEPLKAARSRIAVVLGYSIMTSRPNLGHYLILKSLKDSFREGPSPAAAAAFSYFSSYLCAVGKTDTGYRLAQATLALIDRSNVPATIRSHILLNLNSGLCLKDHIRQTLTPLLDTYALCMESGNPESAAYAALVHCSSAFNAGIPLPDVLSRIILYSEIFESRGQTMTLPLFRIMHRAVSCLMGLQTPPSDEQRDFSANDNPASSDDLAVNAAESSLRLLQEYFNGNYFNALTHSSLTLANRKHDINNGMPFLYCMDSLIRIAFIRTQLSALKTVKPTFPRTARFSVTKRYHLRKISANQKRLKRAADFSPVNYMNKWALVEAECASLKGKKARAESYYRKAIDLSKEHLFMHEEALASELLAKHLLAHDDKAAAKKHLKAAMDLYGTWGAERKKSQLLLNYQSLYHVKNHNLRTKAAAASEHQPDSPSRLNLAELDLQLFSGPLDTSGQNDLQSYLEHLSTSIMHFAGARRVLLLFNRDTVSIGVDNRLGEKIETMKPVSVPRPFPDTLIHYVMRTRKAALMENAVTDSMFASDPYIRQNNIKSTACIPMIYQGRLSAVLYLENNLNTGVFTGHHVKMLTHLCYQTALFLENEFMKEMHSNTSHPPATSDELIRILQAKYELTPQEANISVLLKEGHTRSQICESLNISANTLKRHLQMIYDKTVNFESGFTGSGRADKLSRLILFLFKQCEAPVVHK